MGSRGDYASINILCGTSTVKKIIIFYEFIRFFVHLSIYLSIPSVKVTVMVMSTVHQACCVGPSVYLSIPSVKVTVMVMILSTRLVVWVHLSIYLYHLLR